MSDTSYDIDVSINPDTNFYNRYLLTNPDIQKSDYWNRRESPASDVMVRNVLKDTFSLNYSDYEKLKLAEQYNKLYLNSITESQKQKMIEENKKVYNMSLRMLVENAGRVYIQIINELSIYFTKNDKKSLNEIGYILTKGENMIYVGFLVIVIAFSLWFIDITS